MTTLAKLLPPQAAPAKTILEKAHKLTLTSAERLECPKEIHAEAGLVQVTAAEMRPLEVNDVFLDETGAFWVVRPAAEKILRVTGDVDVMREAVAALAARGVRVADSPNGFAVLPQPNLAQMLAMVGLTTVEDHAPFDPIRIEPRRGSCGGHHRHDHEEGCCCGRHDHEKEEGECCCGGHGHHHGEGECGCGGHHRHDHEEGCCCGRHDHEKEEGECCGRH